MSLLSLESTPVGGLPAEAAARYVGNDAVLSALIADFGLRPYYRNARATYYRVKALEQSMLLAEQDGRLVRDRNQSPAS